MDAEPGRCRRTDGKKWRCSWNVVPDQKYCERHMHRGSNRSRKHVEASGTVATKSTATTSIRSSRTIPTVDPQNINGMNAHVSTTIPVNLQLASPSSNTNNRIPATTNTNITTATTFIIRKPYIEDRESFNVKEERTDATGGISGYTDKYSQNRSNNIHTRNVQVKKERTNAYVKNEFCDSVNDIHNLTPGSNYRNNGNLAPTASPGFGFSPRTVLQGVSPCSECRNFSESELQRCKRTDGKKWRCNREVIPDKKYCSMHIHRGVRKPRTASSETQQVTIAAAASASLVPPLAMRKKGNDSIDVNTDLSIAIKTSPQAIFAKDENSSTSSDATTISDEITSVSHGLAVTK